MAGKVAMLWLYHQLTSQRVIRGEPAGFRDHGEIWNCVAG